MYILMVRLKVEQDHINDFIKASIADGTGSVLHEPGCRRFDIIQDETDPTLFAFNEVYNDEAAFEHHKTTALQAIGHPVKPMLDGAVEVSFCRPVYPLGNANWDAHRPGCRRGPRVCQQFACDPRPAAHPTGQGGRLHRGGHARWPGLDRRGAWLRAVRCLPKYQQAQRVVPSRRSTSTRQRLRSHQNTAHRQVA